MSYSALDIKKVSTFVHVWPKNNCCTIRPKILPQTISGHSMP